MIFSALCATVLAISHSDFDGNIHADYSIDEKLQVLEWRTDVLLELYEKEVLRNDELYKEINELYEILQQLNFKKSHAIL